MKESTDRLRVDYKKNIHSTRSRNTNKDDKHKESDEDHTETSNTERVATFRVESDSNSLTQEDRDGEQELLFSHHKDSHCRIDESFYKRKSDRRTHYKELRTLRQKLQNYLMLRVSTIRSHRKSLQKRFDLRILLQRTQFEKLQTALVRISLEMRSVQNRRTRNLINEMQKKNERARESA